MTDTKRGEYTGFMCRHCGDYCNNPDRAHWSLCGPCSLKHIAAQQRAGNAVSNAIKRGTLRPAREFGCMDCGEPAHQYDHRCYARPLDVDPVCRGCNNRRGVAMPAAV